MYLAGWGLFILCTIVILLSNPMSEMSCLQLPYTDYWHFYVSFQWTLEYCSKDSTEFTTLTDGTS